METIESQPNTNHRKAPLVEKVVAVQAQYGALGTRQNWRRQCTQVLCPSAGVIFIPIIQGWNIDITAIPKLFLLFSDFFNTEINIDIQKGNSIRSKLISISILISVPNSDWQRFT